MSRMARHCTKFPANLGSRLARTYGRNGPWRKQGEGCLCKRCSGKYLPQLAPPANRSKAEGSIGELAVKQRLSSGIVSSLRRIAKMRQNRINQLEGITGWVHELHVLFTLFVGSGTLTGHLIDSTFCGQFSMVNPIWALCSPAAFCAKFSVECSESTYLILQSLGQKT